MKWESFRNCAPPKSRGGEPGFWQAFFVSMIFVVVWASKMGSQAQGLDGIQLPKPRYAWNAYEGYALRQSLSATQSSGEKLAFGEFLIVTRYRPHEAMGDAAKIADLDSLLRNSWCFVEKVDFSQKKSRPLGWVEGKYLVFPESVRDPVTGVHKKAFIKRDPRALLKSERAEPSTGGQAQKPGDSASKEADAFERLIKPQTVPREDAERNRTDVRMTIRFNEMLYIFAETGTDPENDWVLLGTEYQLDPGEPWQQFQHIIIGWFPRWAVETWITREAVQFNSRPERAPRPGKIWGTPEDAWQARPGVVQDRPSASLPRPLFSERFEDGKPIPITAQSLRFPILEWEEESAFKEKHRGLYPEGWELVRVGVEGALVDREGNPLLYADQIKAFQEKLRTLESAVQNLQVLLVIDDTESMRPWFPVAAQAIERSISELWKGHQGNFWLAITYYSDEDLRDPTFKPIRTQQLSNQPSEVRRRLEELRNHQVQRGYDPRELVFKGIIQGIRAAKFDPLATKVVILMGDDADKSDENDPHHAEERRVVEELLQFPLPIYFLAIQVYPENRLAQRPVAAAFRKQMETICRLYEKSLQGVPAAARVISSDQIPIVNDTIWNHLENLKGQQAVLKNDIRRLRLGHVPARIEPGIELALKELGIANELADLRERGVVQLYQTGFVWVPKRGNETPSETEIVLLLSERELQEIGDLLDEFFGEHGEGEFDPLKLSSLLEKAVGEKFKNHFEGLLKSLALKDSGDTLRRIFVQKILGREDFCRLQGFFVRLKDILRKKNFEYERQKETGIWMRGRERPHEIRYFLSFTGAVRWYWIRVWDEWP